MTNELLALIEYYEKDRGIDKDIMIEALKNSVLAASRKSIGPAREMRIKIDTKKGDIKAFATLIVKDFVKNPYDEIDIFTARRINPNVNSEDEIEVDITPENFGRIAAQTARHTMMQKIRQAEKEKVYEEFKDRAGELVSGVVRRFDRGDMYVEIGKFEGIIKQKDKVFAEEYNIGDRIRSYVIAVESTPRGPEIILSRSHPNFVKRLFEYEVSEISDRTIEIKALAREAGYRTKIAVYCDDEKIDPVGACVGLRGSRVKNIVRELNNERVDVIKWSDDIREFVTEALKPAKVQSIDINEHDKIILVKVDEEELSKAIGRKGQNARLTSKLIDWEIQIDKDDSAHEAFKEQVEKASTDIAKAAGIDYKIAENLVKGGLNSLEIIAHDIDEVDIADILSIGVEEAKDILTKIQIAEKKQNSDSE